VTDFCRHCGEDIEFQATTWLATDRRLNLDESVCDSSRDGYHHPARLPENPHT